jgi:hypothetical protein
MKVNEQLLMSLSTELDNLGDLFAARSTNVASLFLEDLLVLLDSLSYCRTRLMERLTLEHGIKLDGLLNEDT